ncbi:MAG: alpha/beta fold hydrolase, partial [Kineosporiaceae bacterium]
MRRTSTLRLRVTALVAAALAVPAAVLSSGPASATTSRGDRTSPVEARRVDRVPTPDLGWFDCSQLAPDAWCATADLPLDYDKPRGATTEVAVLKIKATDQAHKLGTLFINPGGPGGSGTYIAAIAPEFLSESVLARFDIVGFDPRGTNFSANVACWPNMGEQTAAIGPILTTAFPWTSDEKADYVAASKAFGRACSSTGRPLSAHMSTAEVARDMDVLRRAVGDPKLTYMGFSYGTYLGNVYANLFPDRVRAVVIDGVVDADAWAGTRRTAHKPQTARIRSGEGAARAMNELLDRCGTAGADQCELAGHGDPATTYATIMSSLQKSPLTWEDPDYGPQTLSYADLTYYLLGDLYYPDAGAYVSQDLSYVDDLLQPAADPGTERATRQATARRNLRAALHRHHASADREAAYQKAGKKIFPMGFPYDNSQEAFQTVLCTDGLNPRNAG